MKLLRLWSIFPVVLIGWLAACATPAASDEARLARARFVLIGEVHDNAEQHRERAALLRQLLTDGKPTTVVFEQLERGRQTALDAAPREAEALASAGHLDRAAWRWPLHRPLLEAAAQSGATVRGGNLPVDEVRSVVRQGMAAVPAELRPALSTSGWTEADQAQLEQDIDSGHCHALPQSMWAPMALAQRARDAAMAQTMLEAPGERVVLIAGNDHVRPDRGVAFYLRQAGVAERDINTVAYLEAGSDSVTGFDIVHFTAAAPREDPCAAFKSP